MRNVRWRMRSIISVIAVVLIGLMVEQAAAQAERADRPNVVVIFADDLGYADLGAFGHPTIATPNLNRMAAEGQKWTQFYVPVTVCTPSRVALLTGRQPTRVGLTDVLFEHHRERGLPTEEITIAALLSEAGYATQCVGKWHLGHTEEFLPTSHGFDQYYGIPYSNDMRVDPQMAVADDVMFREGMTLERMRDENEQVKDWVPLMRNEQVIEYPADQATITQRYTDEAIRFIEENREGPFFVYLAHTFPHIPLYASEDQQGHSRRGLYGDTVEEIDTSTGRILQTLEELGLAENTLVIFTSDNGPWLHFDLDGGHTGVLSGGKGTTWEGGVRVPTLMWWPGTIEPGATVMELGSTLDVLPTVCALAGIEAPTDRTLDGYDLSGSLLDGEASPRETLFFYRGATLHGVRHGAFKAHYVTHGLWGSPGPAQPEAQDPPKLFQVENDPGEQHDVAGDHPDVLNTIEALVEEHQATMPD